MKPFIAVVVMIVSVLGHSAAGGSPERPTERTERTHPRLERAVANPVRDITGFTIRTAAHWPGPEPGLPSADFVLNAWQEIEQQYRVRRQWIQMPNPDTLLERMMATVLAGEPFAEIIWIEGKNLPVLARNNLILPLDDYIDFSDPRINTQVFPVTTFRGTHFGYVPWVVSPGFGMWYNRTLLQREGLPDPIDLQERGEWTWDRFFAMARAVTRDTTGDGRINQFGLTIGYEIEYPFIASNGAAVVEELADGRFQFALNSAPGIEALDFLARIYASNISTFDSEPAFVAGRAAFYVGMLFQGNNFLNTMRDDYGFVYMPRGPSETQHYTVADPGLMIVFPANVHFPPEKLGEIVLRTTPFEIMDEVRMEFVGGQVRTQRDFDKVLEMLDNTRFQVNASSFPGLPHHVGRIFRDLRAGTSAATAVTRHQQAAQAAIDEALR